MDEEDKKAIVQSLNIRIGSNINDLANALELQTELALKRDKLQSSVSPYHHFNLFLKYSTFYKNCLENWPHINVFQTNWFIQFQLNIANNEVPTKLAAALEKAELNSDQIDKLKTRSEELKKKVEAFLNKTEPLRCEVDKRFAAINKLEEVLVYLKSFEKIDELRFV